MLRCGQNNAAPGKYWPWGQDGVAATMGRFALIDLE